MSEYLVFKRSLPYGLRVKFCLYHFLLFLYSEVFDRGPISRKEVEEIASKALRRWDLDINPREFVDEALKQKYLLRVEDGLRLDYLGYLFLKRGIDLTLREMVGETS